MSATARDLTRPALFPRTLVLPLATPELPQHHQRAERLLVLRPLLHAARNVAPQGLLATQPKRRTTSRHTADIQTAPEVTLQRKWPHRRRQLAQLRQAVRGAGGVAEGVLAAGTGATCRQISSPGVQPASDGSDTA